MIKHTHCKILDTRKTTPNFRYAEKFAVMIGGGINHRMGLFDAILIKDNHIDYCGGIKNTLKKTEKYLNKLDKKIDNLYERLDGHINKIDKVYSRLEEHFSGIEKLLSFFKFRK